MFKIIIKLFLIFFAISQFANSQTIDLYGKVESKLNVENIHVINKTAQIFTVTNVLGEFKIPTKLNDTIILTSIQHKQVSILVDKNIISNKVVLIELEELINSLDEVVVGKVLSGNMLLDIGNVEGAPMTSKKAGIPSYQGKPKTQSEKRFYDADHGKYIYYYGLGVSINVHKILNKVSGRTKKLKQHVLIEDKIKLINNLRVTFSDDLFFETPFNDNLKDEFFYFVSEDKNFLKICKGNNDIATLEFLRMKLIHYKERKCEANGKE